MKKVLFLWIIHFFRVLARHWTPSDMNTVSLVSYHGYKIETHRVFTEDGYLLRIHRIPHNRQSNTIGPPVFLQHGLNCASDLLVMRTPDKDLAYILSDSGYDVWLGNSRGNPYSPGYVSTFNNTFWNFSFHEMGIYDLSAEIDYILKTTGYSNLSYVGHSLGGSIVFVLLSERPAYNEKINVVIGFVPSVYISESWFLRKTTTKILVRFAPFLYRLLSKQSFFMHGKDMRTKSKIMHIFSECGENSPKRQECERIYMRNALTNNQQFDLEYILPVRILTKCGTSMKNIIHICQNAVLNDFTKFDYGSSENMKIYGTSSPPVYNLKSITTPVALYIAQNDEVLSFESNRRLAREIKNLYRFFVVDSIKFNHRDFIFARDANTLVYEDVLKVIKECVENKKNARSMSSDLRQRLNIAFNKTTVQSNSNCDTNNWFKFSLKNIFSSLCYRTEIY